MAARRFRIDWGPLLLGLVLVLAFILRFAYLGSRPLYQDEHFNTVEVAAQPLSFIISTNLGSILYPLILHFILPLGDTALMARLPAALFGFLSVLLIYLIAKILFSRKEALLAAFLSATAAHYIYFSQQARGYSGLLLFALCSFYFFLRVLKEGRLLDWGAYVVFTVAAVYAYFFALIIIPVQIFFVAVLWLKRGITKKKAGAFAPSRKHLGYLAVSLVSIAAATILLYSPVKHATRYVDLRFMLTESVRGLFKGALTLDPLSFIGDTLKRQFDFSSNPALFFVRLALAVSGIAACLKNKRREVVFLLAAIILPLALFILSNPPAIYIPADNKLIFIPAMIFILIAKGVSGLASVLGLGLSSILKLKNRVRPGAVIYFALVILIIAVEGLVFRTYGLTMWDLRSLDRGNELSAGLKEQIQGEEMLLADSAVARLNFLSARPLVYPGGGKKGLMIYEQSGNLSRQTAASSMGLWVIVNRQRLDERIAAEWGIPADEMKFRSFSRESLLHWDKPGQPVWDKYVQAARLLLRCSNRPREETSYRLFIARVYLSAGKNREALEELADLEKRSAGSPLPRPAHRDKVLEILEKSLRESIVVQLLENADREAHEGRLDEALSLQKEAENFSAFNPELRPRIYFSLAETYVRKGMGDEAHQQYFRALVLSRNQKEEDLLVKKIAQLYSLPFGYMVWRQEGHWHLRWWSDQRRTFSGEITGSLSSKKMIKLRWTKDDSASFSGHKLVFRGVSDKGRIKGFDLKARAGTSPAFLLTIHGSKNVAEKIIIPARGGHPVGVPFSLD